MTTVVYSVNHSNRCQSGSSSNGAAGRTPLTNQDRKGNLMAKTMTKAQWQDFADRCAIDAGENYFEHHWGQWYFSGLDVVCFYNNNPYANYPDLRDQEVAEFRKRLAAAGIKELAYATDPPPGAPSAGYTFAMIVDIGMDRVEELRGWWDEIRRKPVPQLNCGNETAVAPAGPTRW
jgi:hypothetical protein